MRSLAFWGLAATAALLPAAAMAQHDSGRMAPARGGMSVGQGAPAVPSMQLRPPAGWNGGSQPAPGGWSNGGWQGGNHPTPPGGGMPPPGGGWQGGGHPGPGGWQGGNHPGPGGWQGGNHGPGGWHGGHHQGGGWVGHGSWGSRSGWGGFPGGYHRPHFGRRLPGFFLGPSFFIGDWGFYGLGDPGYGRNWVRYYDDAVLVDGDGQIYDTRPGIDWDRYNAGLGPDDGDDYGYDDRGYDGRYDYRSDGVTYGGRYGVPGGPQVYVTQPGSTTVVITTAPAVMTTTTTSYVEEVYAAAPRRARRVAVHRARPRCVCTYVCR